MFDECLIIGELIVVYTLTGSLIVVNSVVRQVTFHLGDLFRLFANVRQLVLIV